MDGLGLRSMGTTLYYYYLYWGNIGIMENQMENQMEKKMENDMETGIIQVDQQYVVHHHIASTQNSAT